MASRDWIIPKLLENGDVEKAIPLEDIYLEIHSKQGNKLIAAILPDSTVTLKIAEAALSHKTIHPQIIVTVPRNSLWSGGAIDLARSKGIAWGGVGELHRAIDSHDIPSIQKKEYDFVERLLRQHDKVAGLERVYDRVYKIKRTIAEPLKVMLMNEYEITAEHVRQARDTYGEFDIILKTNSYGGITTGAIDAAKLLSIEILKFGPFLGRLNKT